MTGYVYAIADSHSRVKIGWSEEPAKRFAKLRSDNGSQCRMIGVIPATREQERDIHASLSKWRLTGEWFDMTAPEVESFVSSTKPIEKRRKPVASAHPLAAYIHDREITAAEFARRIGVPTSTITRIINTPRRMPGMEILERIADETGGKVMPNDFMSFGKGQTK